MWNLIKLKYLAFGILLEILKKLMKNLKKKYWNEIQNWNITGLHISGSVRVVRHEGGGVHGKKQENIVFNGNYFIIH